MGLIVKIKKYDFVKKKLKFFEHIISKKKIRMDSEKIEKMVNMELSKNLKKLKLRFNTSKDFLILPSQYTN